MLSKEPKIFEIFDTVSDLCNSSVASIANATLITRDSALLASYWGCTLPEKASVGEQLGGGLVLVVSVTNEAYSAGSDSRDMSDTKIPFIIVRPEDIVELRKVMEGHPIMQIAVHTNTPPVEQCARRVHNYAEVDMRALASDAFFRCYDPALFFAEPSYKGCMSSLNMSRTLDQLEHAFEARELLMKAKSVCWFADYPDYTEPSKHKLLFDAQGNFVCTDENGNSIDWFDCKIAEDRVEYGILLHLGELHLKLGDLRSAAAELGQLRVLSLALVKRAKRQLKKACGALALVTFAQGDFVEAVKLYVGCDLSPQDVSTSLLWDGIKSGLQELTKFDPDVIVAAQNTTAPKECCVPDWKSIYSVDKELYPVCELAISHSLMGVFLDEVGELSLANFHFEKLHKLCKDSGMSLRVVLGTKVVPSSEDSMHEDRQQLIAQVRKLRKGRTKSQKSLAFPLETLDFLWTQTPATMMIGYQNLNDNSVLQEIAQMYSFIWPDLLTESIGPLRDDDVSRPLKVGFASCFFGDHSVAKLIKGVIEKLSRRKDFDVYMLVCPDGENAKKAYGKSSMIDLKHPLNFAGAQIAELELDVLIYPELGMHSFTYFLSFQRLAPVQAVFWGHPVSQGSPAIDYFITSDLYELDPSKSWTRYTEQHILMEGLTTFYDKPVHEKKKRWKIRLNFGLPKDGALYICAQTLMKFHPTFDIALREILRRDPGGTLVITYNKKHTLWRYKLEERFRRVLGTKLAQRVYFIPSLKYADYQSLLALADVVLDPFPWGGGVTTLEALATARIVVTLPSEQSVVQLSAGFLKQLGVEGMIAKDVDDYINLAMEFGKNGSRRAEESTKILEHSSNLYSNKEVVKEWAAMLQKIGRLY